MTHMMCIINNIVYLILDIRGVILMKIFKKLSAILTATALAAAMLAAYTAPASAVVTVDDGVFQYTYSNNTWQLYSYIGSDTELTLPRTFAGEPVTGICEQCFMSSGVTSVEIPEGYTSVGNYAFYECESLQAVTLPSTITEIGMGAFAKSGVTSADLSQTKANKVNHYLFMNCASLAQVSLPPNAEFIGEAAFAGTALTGVEVPDKVTAIDRAAFADTGSLTAAVLPNGLKSIGESSFENSALSSVELPETLESIGAHAFRSDTSLTELYIPDSVTEIGAYALYPMSVSSRIHVTCFEGSYAETYCYENFVMNTDTVKKIYGDANLDGVVNINDVTAIQIFCAEYDDFTRPQLVTADVTHSGNVDISDATMIQQYLAEYITL